MLDEPLFVVSRVVSVLDALDVPYAIGGSLASSVYGVPRSTHDADLVASLGLKDVDAFVSALRGEFYVDEGMIRDAVSRGSCFNVIHLATMFKVDVFIAGRDPWAREELGRTRAIELDVGGNKVVLDLASPEDTLLHKLVWFRLGGGVSERQWRDVLGVLEVQGTALDHGYLDLWAVTLNVSDLLERARREVESVDPER
jgi:hypothetical protein